MKKKFVIVGTGNRGIGCFAKGIMSFPNKGRPEFKDHAEIVAMVDSNLTRCKNAAIELGLPNLPIFHSIKETAHLSPDWCIVTTPDLTHCDVVCEALHTGINCLVDKPLATSAHECQKIIDTMNETGKEVIVGHNMRYFGHHLKAAKLIREGAIGDILSIEAAEILDHGHGGDYFHRWHSDFSKSAGMMNHKGCHFIDVLNWFIDDTPVRVQASGDRRYYKPRPELNHGKTCRECTLKESCTHYYDMDKWDGIHRRLYGDAEDVDGYVRDLCVFSDRHTINDHENLIITYEKGAIANFSLITFGPSEFSYFYINGTKGRLEIGGNSIGEKFFRIVRPGKQVENFEREKSSGEHGHGGADMRLIGHILGIDDVDPMFRAYPIDAKKAVDVADMAARSVAKGGVPITINEIGKDFPPAPPQK